MKIKLIIRDRSTIFEGGTNMLNEKELSTVAGGFDSAATYNCPQTGCAGTLKLSSKTARVEGCLVTLYYCDKCLRYYSSEQAKGNEDLTTDYSAYIVKY